MGCGRAECYERQQAILRTMEGKHVMSALLYIDEMGPVLKTDIYRDVSGGACIAGKIESLEELGMAEIYNRSGSISCYVCLTPKGRRVATTIKLMQQVIDDGLITRRSARKGRGCSEQVTEEDVLPDIG